jgi:hypothetical protein
MAARENRQLAGRTMLGRRWMLDKHILPRIGSIPVEDLRRTHVKECIRDIQASVPRNGRSLRLADDSVGTRAANMCHGLIKHIFN